jgi:hypothetical protein
VTDNKARALRVMQETHRARPSDRPSKDIREEWQARIKRNLEQYREDHRGQADPP